MKKSRNNTIVTALLSSAVTAAVMVTAYGLPVSESADAKPAYHLDVNYDGKVNIMDLNVLKTELFNTEKLFRKLILLCRLRMTAGNRRIRIPLLSIRRILNSVMK